MPYLKGIEDLRVEDYAKEYLWDLYFPPQPDLPWWPNLKWWPAVDVVEDLASLTSQDIPQYISNFKFPGGTTPFTLTVTFIEFADFRILKWLRTYMTMLQPTEASGRQYIECLQESARPVIVERLFPWADRNPDGSFVKNANRQVVESKTYQIYPEGELQFHGSSESSPIIFSQIFNIVG